MRSAAARVRRLAAALALLLGTAAAAVLLPAPESAIGAGLVAAVLAIIVASTVASAPVMPAGVRVGARTRVALERLVPRASQSDPDARGHARPRAPGALLPAV
jgi:hypothetical protein